MTGQTNTSVDLAVQQALLPVMKEMLVKSPHRTVPSIASGDGSGKHSLLSDRGRSLKPSATVAAASLATPETLRFDIGQSGFGPSEEMIQWMLDAGTNGNWVDTLEAHVRYHHSDYLRWSRRLKADPSQTVSGLGLKPLVFNTLRALERLSSRAGKKMVVAVPSPYWVSYPELKTHPPPLAYRQSPPKR